MNTYKDPATQKEERDDLAHELAEEASKSLLDSCLGRARDRDGHEWLNLMDKTDVEGVDFCIDRAVRYLEGEGILRRCPTDLNLIGWDNMDEEVDV